MKYILRILGGIFMIVAAINSSNYIMDYSTLSEYGKGYVWGNILLGSLGAIMLYFGFRNIFKNKDAENL